MLEEEPHTAPIKDSMFYCMTLFLPSFTQMNNMEENLPCKCPYLNCWEELNKSLCSEFVHTMPQITKIFRYL